MWAERHSCSTRPQKYQGSTQEDKQNIRERERKADRTWDSTRKTHQRDHGVWKETKNIRGL